MELTAKLNAKFYVVTVLFSGIVVLGWYGIWFLNSNVILMENESPMTGETKMLFTLFMAAAVLSWSVSLVSMLRQILFGCAFKMDESGIHTTSTVMIFLAFILVIPIKTIPYDAIVGIKKENNVIILHIDKARVTGCSFLRLFIRKQYSLFEGFTTVNKMDIENILNIYVKR